MAFPSSRGYIRVDNFLTYTAVIGYATPDRFGQGTITSSISAPCTPPYVEGVGVSDTTPMATTRNSIFSCVPSSLTVSANDHITITDPNGTTVISDKRIVNVLEFHHHRCGARIQQLTIDLGLL